MVKRRLGLGRRAGIALFAILAFQNSGMLSFDVVKQLRVKVQVPALVSSSAAVSVSIFWAASFFLAALANGLPFE